MDYYKTGDIFGEYTIKRKLGSGGMSDVYLAMGSGNSGRDNQYVAIKILHNIPNKENESRLRFEKEINAVKDLNHPGIVSIIDVGEINGLQYYAMDYLPGGSLRDKIKAGIGIKESIHIIERLSEALNYAHNKGYIHRDIKPENVLFNAIGEPVITDLGVVKSISLDTRLTQTGIGIGTPYYMSPEQARGAEWVDGRSDIYSLGILFYEMLIGEIPYDGDSAVSIIMKHVESPIPKLPKYLSSFQPVLNKMLAKKADERYLDCAELAVDLKQLFETEENNGNQRDQQNTTCVDIDVNGKKKPKRPIFFMIFILLVIIALCGFFFVSYYGETDKDLVIVPSEIKLEDKNINKVDSKQGRLKETKVIAEDEPVKKASDKNEIKPVSEKPPKLVETKNDVFAGGTEKDNLSHDTIQNNGPPVLRIETIPSGAEIIINGRPFGRTPYYGRDIASGDHVLELRLKNYESYSSELELKPGISEERKISLEKAKGSLVVKTIPVGAKIIIDGKQTGKSTPQVFYGLEAGEHSVKVQMPKYYPSTTKITINGGEQFELIKELKGGDLVLHNGKWISKDQQIAKMLQQAEGYIKDEKFGIEDGDKALDTYNRILTIDVENQKAKAGLKKLAQKYFQHATYYCEEELFSQCFEYIQKTLDIDDTLVGVKELRSDSIVRLAWNRVLAGENSIVREAIVEIKKQYHIDDDTSAESSIDYQDRVAEVEKDIDDGDWEKSYEGIASLEIKSGMENVAEQLRQKYQALKDYYRTGRIIRDRLKDGTLGPRMVVIPVFKSDKDGGGNNKLFLIGETEISNGEYEKFLDHLGMEKTEGKSKYPTVRITYDEAKVYAKWLSEQTGKRYRLPTSQELDFAYGGKTANKSEKYCSPFMNYEEVFSGNKNSFGVIGYDRNVWEMSSTCANQECNTVLIKGGAKEDKSDLNIGFETLSYCGSSIDDAQLFDIGAKNLSVGFRILREMN